MPGKFSRRQFGKLTGSSVLGLACESTKLEASEANQAADECATGKFPRDFVWGTATSAFQIEGAVKEDGRGASIWDAFVRMPGKVEDGSNAEVADDHYHRYKQDVGLMKRLGVKAYRFSIAWPRVFPDGDATPNPKGLDFYKRLVDELLRNDIEPYATLYHWDLPQSLQDRFGGWQSERTSHAFGRYAGYVAARLDGVKHFFTLNESSRFVNFGYGTGDDAPGVRLAPAELNQVRHNAALGHGHAVRAIRAERGTSVKVGPAEDIEACIPAVATPENVVAAEKATRFLNAGFLDVILEGRYLDDFLRAVGKDAPKFTPGQLEIISTPIDFVGLNIYFPKHYVVASDNALGFRDLRFPDSFPHMRSDWLRVGPETAYWVPRLAAKVWKELHTIYISENGTSSADRLVNGEVDDVDRIMFLRSYLGQLQRATREGVPVRGYFAWSLMDNFEWTFGYAQRFGLYYVDFKTQARTPKLSASLYREIIAQNAVSA